MTTTSKVTLALILVALVGCGPKPAFAKDLTCSPAFALGFRDSQRVELIKQFNPKFVIPDECFMAHRSFDPFVCDDKIKTEYEKIPIGQSLDFEPPSIDKDPYRFIGGQRYGEGWPVPAITFTNMYVDKEKMPYCCNDGDTQFKSSFLIEERPEYGHSQNGWLAHDGIIEKMDDPHPVTKVDKIPESACKVTIWRNGLSYESTVDPCVAGTTNLAKDFVEWACMNKCFDKTWNQKACEIQCGKPSL